ncbi:MAG: fumarate hydratase [Firmicutes bacterium]|nr:fumarate hydratase [Bacillota bacterium]MBQ3198761.1 fumarate hydratase [Bacillota bacterium]
MRELQAGVITDAIEKLCMDAAYNLPEDVKKALAAGKDNEQSPAGKYILEQVCDNYVVAAEEEVALCQDTGTALFIIEMGQELVVTGGGLVDAINEGVRRGYTNGYLRKSMVAEPIFERVNTKDNTPAVIHYEIVEGDGLKITLLPKGGGAENCCACKMLRPADGLAGVMDFVVDTVRQAGGKPCPPVVVGVGVGGTSDYAAYLSKKALNREIGVHNANPNYEKMEIELLERVNNLGIGPQGLGGVNTALAVNVEYFPCHIASLPVFVTLNCHSQRHKSVEL